MLSHFAQIAQALRTTKSRHYYSIGQGPSLALSGEPHGLLLARSSLAVALLRHRPSLLQKGRSCLLFSQCLSVLLQAPISPDSPLDEAMINSFRASVAGRQRACRAAPRSRVQYRGARRPGLRPQRDHLRYQSRHIVQWTYITKPHNIRQVVGHKGVPQDAAYDARREFGELGALGFDFRIYTKCCRWHDNRWHTTIDGTQ